jgi:hypothetical protein
MKVIAIKDAPIRDLGYMSNGVFYSRLYNKGDIFEAFYEQDKKINLIIQHDKFNADIQVDPDNFVDLDEWRESKINQVLQIT